MVKMLAIDPQQRVPLTTLLLEDPWMVNGPKEGGQLTMLEYRLTMDSLFLELSGEQPQCLQQCMPLHPYHMMNPEEQIEEGDS